MDDDQILDTSGDDDLVTEAVAEIAGVQPPIVPQYPSCLLGGAEISLHQAGPAGEDAAHLSLPKGLAFWPTDRELVTGQHLAAQGEFAAARPRSGMARHVHRFEFLQIGGNPPQPLGRLSVSDIKRGLRPV